jgi:type II secretory ATPase GspE/PulE/Tfp pilus assembly ATPase PilB-like protein
MSSELMYLAQHAPAFLINAYKPFLMFVPFIPWAWLISSALDKDARYYHFNWKLWNSIHLSAGAAALIAMLFIPIFWIGWPVGMLLLVTPILVYWRYRNERVPEAQRFYLTGEGLAASMATRRQAKASREAMMEFVGPEDEKHYAPVKEDPAYPVHMTVEDLLGPAIDARASAIEMKVEQSGCTVTQIIDGIRYKREPVPADAGLKAIDYLKNIADLDLDDRRRRQTGEFLITRPEGKTKASATTAGSSTGLVMRLDFDRANRLSVPFDRLGLLASQLDVLTRFADAHDRHGIILFGAPPTHGLTTTGYSLISRHDAYTSNIKTLEREVKLRIDGVDHVQFDPSNPDVDYPTNLQSILRRDPDIVLIDEIKEAETARVATDPGMQGPLIYIPQRAGTVPEQIRDWVKVVGDVKRATRALRAVMNQRLVRSLCPNCRQAYQPSEDQIRKLNLPAGKISQLYRPGGKVQVKNKIESCPVCQGTGFLGQTGVFEVLHVDDDVRGLLAGGDLKAALAHARRNKMIYLQEAALSKVAAGETSLDEVMRILSPAKSASPSPRQEPKPAPTG